MYTVLAYTLRVPGKYRPRIEALVREPSIRNFQGPKPIVFRFKSLSKALELKSVFDCINKEWDPDTHVFIISEEDVPKVPTKAEANALATGEMNRRGCNQEEYELFSGPELEWCWPFVIEEKQIEFGSGYGLLIDKYSGEFLWFRSCDIRPLIDSLP